MRDVEHTVVIAAETLCEAVAAALAALEQDSWVGEIAQVLNTISVLVQQPPVKHEVKIKDFLIMARAARRLSRRCRAPRQNPEYAGEAKKMKCSV